MGMQRPSKDSANMSDQGDHSHAENFWERNLGHGPRATVLLVGLGFFLGLMIAGVFLVLSNSVSNQEGNPNETSTSAKVILGETKVPHAIVTLGPETLILSDYSIRRMAMPHTDFRSDLRFDIIEYTIQEGDALLVIAEKYGLKPETLLYCNYHILGDDPYLIFPGLSILIPPIDGAVYFWQTGDDLYDVAQEYNVTPDKIIYWPDNHLDLDTLVDLSIPNIPAGTRLFIPGGWRIIQPWVQPLPYAYGAGVTQVIEGPGGCAPGDYNFIGQGSFIWPTSKHELSGWDFSNRHMAIDISAKTGDPVYAADSGSVVYAGWNDTGYGNMVMIDHGNGYETLYAQLSQVYVSCGDGVYQGAVIGAAGSTGRSTGPNVHFEVRFN